MYTYAQLIFIIYNYSFLANKVNSFFKYPILIPLTLISEMLGLINSFTDAGINWNSSVTSTNESTAASTNDSTRVLADRSIANDGISHDESQANEEVQKETTAFGDRNSLSEHSSRHSTADTINSALSSRGMDSFCSKNSGSVSRESSASRQSSGRGRSSSREELLASTGSCEDMAGETSESLQAPMQSSTFLSLTDDSTLTAPHHTSFGKFPLEKDSKRDELQKIKQEVVSGEDKTIISQPLNSRRFSEGASPWESSSLLPYERKPKIPESTNELEADDGYGFNFSSFSNRKLLPPETVPEEEIKTDSTTLEDVLDSLLALPSSSRSPSPSSGPHPLSLVQPYAPQSFFSETTSAKLSECPKEQDIQLKEQSFSSFFRDKNRDTGRPDPKTETYHKKISSTTFTPTRPAKVPCPTVPKSSATSRNIILKKDERSSKPFYHSKDEGELRK